MSPALQILLSFCLTFGIPLLIAVHELRTLRRGGSGRGRRRPEPEPVPPRPIAGGTPFTGPLPDCLIPKLPERRRQLELT